ncbi:MAG: Fic family protein [Acholeplasmatales bacterium]|nr:Fic family protein [Acholeplasmatales bacterium]
MKDNYVYDGTNVLMNLAGIKDQKKLDDFETTMANLGIIKLLKEYPDLGNVEDIFFIHQVIFENVYGWAGKSRTINIYKEEPILHGLSVEYSDYREIHKNLKSIQNRIDNLDWDGLSKNEVVSEIIKIISSIWQVHAFREGNTRVVTLFLYYFMKKQGFKVDRKFIGKHVKYFRNALVLSSIGEYSEYNYLEEILKDSISFKINDINNEDKYQTIKGYNLKKYKYNYHSSKESK